MNRTVIVALVILLVGGVAVSRGWRSATSGKKIVIEVSTPNGVVRGESVIETRNYKAPWWYPVSGNGGGIAQRGEAAYVDLGEGRFVFVTLANQMHGRPISHLLSPQDLTTEGNFKAGSRPLLVTFADNTDPNSVRQVDPDNFPTAFGRGYELRRLAAIDTTEPATRGTLAARFPELHRNLLRPAAERIAEADGEPSRRGDLRRLGWDAFEAQDW